MTAPRPTATAVPAPGQLAVVIGLGRSALALVRFLIGRGVRVRVLDAKPAAELGAFPDQVAPEVELRLGGYGPEALGGVAAVFASPGVAWRSDILELARSRGLPVSSEMDLFFQLCRAPIVGITGTNGKTTTTALAGRLLERTGRRVLVGGNIGETVLDRVAELGPADWAVLELSSFQLESIARPRVHLGAVLNITPDHLDRHGSFGAYVDAKARIVEFAEPDDFAVLNGEDPVCRELAGRTRAQVVWFDRHLPVPRRIPLPGAHNRANVLAAAAIARLAGLSDADIEAGVAEFPGVEHRLEPVGEWGGVRWFNDSKATNPEAARVGLAAFAGTPVVLIAGGQGHFDLDPWLEEVRRATSAVVLLGESAPELERRLAGGPPVVRVESLEEAVAVADRAAAPGSVVLLSPGHKSFDLFRDFEDRGRQFKAAVRARKG